MRVVIQRVKRASVIIDEQTVSEIGKGLLCLVGVHEEDRREHAEWMSKQILTAKLFEGLGEENADKRWRSNVKQNGLEVLMVSQFTLNGRVCKKGSVDFGGSMPPAEARTFYDNFFRIVQESYSPELVKDGVFGAKMEVALVNDGPITLIVDSNDMREGAIGTVKKRDIASGGERARGAGSET